MVKQLIRYFRNPLFGISGYTSYGLPNSALHLPVILIIPYIGISICGAEMKILLPVYFIIALYAGRDLAIMSYRNYFVPAMIWAVVIVFIIYKKELSRFLTFHSPRTSLIITLAILTGFIGYVTSIAYRSGRPSDS